MGRQKTQLTAILIFFSLTFSLTWADQVNFWSDLPPDELADSLIRQMTPEQLLGQVMMLGYWGDDEPSPEIMDWISEKHIGGVKVFGWNARNLKNLAGQIRTMQREAAKDPLQIPLFVATDQEGGWVRHVKGETSITPGNLAIGAAGLKADAYYSGYYIAQELHALGINMNFAPTVDIYTSPEANVIGPRAFSADPVRTAELGVAFYHGMEKAGVIATAKHFPGHGAASEDSHGTLPAIDVTFDELWEREMIPYRFLIRENIPAIMSGHLSFPNIIDPDEPTSTSPFFLTEVLRNRMGFEGVVVTDDLRMHGARQNQTSAESALLALKAGNDIILSSPPHSVHQEALDLMTLTWNEDPEFQERIRQAVKRILLIKIRYLKGDNPVPLYPDPETVLDHMNTEENRNFTSNLAARSVTLIHEGVFPPRGNPKILLAGPYRLFLEEGERRFPDADQYYFSYSPGYAKLREQKQILVEKAKDYDLIIFCLANYKGYEMLRELEDSGKQVIVLSVLTPVYLLNTPWVDGAVAVYGTGFESFRSGFAALSGDFFPEGVLDIPTYEDTP